MNDNNIYKSNVETSAHVSLQKEIETDIERNADRFRDPLVLGELVFKLLEERENTNRILKNILAKLEKFEARFEDNESRNREGFSRSSFSEILLPSIDEDILTFVKKQSKATAEEVRQQFNYKGTNAASARLNRLFELQLLEKRQVGKKVYFLPRNF